MPSTTRVLCFTPGELMRRVALDPNVLQPSVGAGFEVTLSSLDGFRSVRVAMLPVELEVETHYMLISLGASAIAPARWFLDSNGFETSISFHYYSPDFDLDDMTFIWQQRLVELKKDMIDNWTDGAADEPSYATVDSFSGIFRSVISNVFVNTTTEALSFRDRYVLSHFNTSGYDFGTMNPPPPTGGTQITSLSTNGSTEAVVKALDQIARRDVSIVIGENVAVVGTGTEEF